MKKFAFVFIIAIIVTSCSKYPDIGEGYKLDSDGKYSLQIINSENTVMVSAHILEYIFDTTYIIVSQRPWDSIPNIKTMNYKQSIEAFEKSTFRQYWIIDKKMRNEYFLDTLSKRVKYSNVYSPFKRDGYLQKRKELKIANEFVLKE